MPLLSGNVNVTCCPDGSGPSRGRDSRTVVAVTLVTVVPGAMRPWQGRQRHAHGDAVGGAEENFKVFGLVGVPEEGFTV